MNADFVKNALWRVENDKSYQSKWDIIDSFMGSDSTVGEFKGRLVGLLKYADVSNRSDSELRNAGLMRVPKDADGVPIHVGDRLRGCGHDDEAYCQAIVNASVIAVGKQFSRFKEWEYWNVAGIKHYKEPTVEDLLREFAREFNRDDSELSDDEIIEAFAKRLRLADE